jgi:hypothetical protein
MADEILWAGRPVRTGAAGVISVPGFDRRGSPGAGARPDAGTDPDAAPASRHRSRFAEGIVPWHAAALRQCTACSSSIRFWIELVRQNNCELLAKSRS